MIDRNDWNATWFDRGAWIFAHLEQFSLTPAETLMVLVINYLNEANLAVTPDTICSKTGLDPEQVDAAIESLSARGYLSVETSSKKLRFLLEGLVDASQAAGQPIAGSLISQFSAEFGRPLSPAEMERITALGEQYPESMVLHALDECAIYEKYSVAYAETILAAWKKKGLSEQDVEEGRR